MYYIFFIYKILLTIKEMKVHGRQVYKYRRKKKKGKTLNTNKW